MTTNSLLSCLTEGKDEDEDDARTMSSMCSGRAVMMSGSLTRRPVPLSSPPKEEAMKGRAVAATAAAPRRGVGGEDLFLMPEEMEVEVAGASSSSLITFSVTPSTPSTPSQRR